MTGNQEPKSVDLTQAAMDAGPEVRSMQLSIQHTARYCKVQHCVSQGCQGLAQHWKHMAVQAPSL